MDQLISFLEKLLTTCFFTREVIDGQTIYNSLLSVTQTHYHFAILAIPDDIHITMIEWVEKFNSPVRILLIERGELILSQS